MSPAETKRRYRASDKGRAENRERMRRRRALLTGAAATIRRQLDRARFGVCWWCGDYGPACWLDVDHDTPLLSGGTDTLDNCQVLCKTCHGVKTAAER